MPDNADRCGYQVVAITNFCHTGVQWSPTLKAHQNLSLSVSFKQIPSGIGFKLIKRHVFMFLLQLKNCQMST